MKHVRIMTQAWNSKCDMLEEGEVMREEGKAMETPRWDIPGQLHLSGRGVGECLWVWGTPSHVVFHFLGIALLGTTLLNQTSHLVSYCSIFFSADANIDFGFYQP